MKKFRYLSIEDVEWAHERILEVTGGERGDLAKANLEFVLEAVKDVGQDIDFEKSLVKKAAFLLHSLVTRHPFVNGNKRTAIEVADTFLELNHYSLRPGTEQTVTMVTSVGSGAMSQAGVEEWIAMNLVRKAPRKKETTMRETQRSTKQNESKNNGVNKEVIRIIEKNLRKHREILERLAKI